MHIKVVQRGFVLQNQRYILPDAQIDQPGAEIPLIPEAALLCRSLACAPNLPHFVRRMENQHIQHEMLRRLQKVGHVKGEILIHALVFAQQMPVQVDHAGIIDTLEVQEGLAVRCAKDGAEKAAATLPVQDGAFAGTLTIPSPELWYPNGLGEQPLYNVTLTLRNGETVLDERTMRQGIRHFEMIQNEDAPTGALPYTIIMNGERVYMKGVNITPMDHIYGDIPAEQVAYQLHQAKRLNVNIVRVWGGGVIETETFYRLCDELGLLVWQEFIQSSSGVDNIPSELPHFLTLLRQSAVHALKVKRNHTSLVIWRG